MLNMQFISCLLTTLLLMLLGEASSKNPESCVFDKIFTDYHKEVRPVYNISDAIDLEFKFVFRSLGGISEREETIDTVGYIVMEWNDFQLQWDPEECNGTRQIKIPSQNIWLPEIITSNSNNDFHQYTFKRDFGAWVRHDGFVHWAHGGLFSTVCDMNLETYPFDQHNCSIVFESWLYNATEITIKPTFVGTDTGTSERDTQWALKDMGINYYEVAVGWPSVRVSFIWKRKIEFHVFNIICPTAFILAVALGVFWLPAESGEKVSLAITVLLAFSVIQLVIMDIMPPSSENIPRISLMVVGVMCLSTLSVLTSMIVVYISFKSEQTPVPSLLRRVLYSRLTWVLGLQAELPFEDFKVLYETDDTLAPSPETNGIKHFVKDDMHVYDVISHLTKLDSKENLTSTPKGSTKGGSERRRINEETLGLLREISQTIRAILRMKKEESKDASVVAEWKVLAKVIDRIIFFVCFVSLITWLLSYA